MVMKKCKICGKEFDARRSTVTCSVECRKINQREYQKNYRKNNPEYQKEWHNKNPEYRQKYRENHLDELRECYRKYYWNHRDERLAYAKEYRVNHRDELLKKDCIRHRNIISELCEQYDGDLKEILDNIPNQWQVREAQMRVWFNKSYYDGIMAKIESTPVCEVTAKSNNLVIHHLDSFNLHPELGADPNNMVRITEDIHDEFHSIYGYGNNTREQWNEFIRLYGFRKFF